jgi:opacity protein-like surface antigen
LISRVLAAASTAHASACATDTTLQDLDLMTKHSLSAVVAASLVSYGLPATSAIGANLGVSGSCCADLEERVAVLEATTARKGNRKVSLFDVTTPRQGNRTDKTGRFMAVASAAFILFLAVAASGPVQAQNYDGDGLLRFGAFVQGADLEFDVQRPAAAAGTASADGFGGGVSFGYDWGSRKSLVLGVEADASIDDSSDKIKGRSFASDYLATLRGRLGAHLQPGWLVYATGGVAFLGVEYQRAPSKLTIGTTTIDVPGAKLSETLTGWTVGGGTEIDLHPVTLFAEYLFANFDTFDFSDDDPATLAKTLIPHEVDVDEHLVRVGVKFKIGHDFYDDDVRKRLK